MRDRKFLDDTDLRYVQSFGQDELTVLARQANSGVFTVEIKAKVLIVYFITKFRISEFTSTLKRTPDFELCLVVLNDKLTAPNARTIAEYSKKNACTIQTFILNDLQYNITRHVLVPKHEVISDETEVESLLKQLQVKSRHQLPSILRSDPIARYFGVKPGNIMKITRVSPSAGQTVFYRCVV